MANVTQIQGSISSDSSNKKSLSIFEISTLKSIEQQSTNTNGVYSTVRIDSHEQDGFGVAIQMLQHWRNYIRGWFCNRFVDLNLSPWPKTFMMPFPSVDLFSKSDDEFTGIDFLAELDKDEKMYLDGKLVCSFNFCNWDFVTKPWQSLSLTVSWSQLLYVVCPTWLRHLVET